MADEGKEVKEEANGGEGGEEAAEGDAPATGEAAGGSPSVLKLVADGFLNWFKTKKAKVAIVGFLCITGGLAGLFSYQASAIPVKSLADVLAGVDDTGGGGGTGKDPFAKFTDQSATAPLSSNTQEGATSNSNVDIQDKNVYKVTFILTWTDEADTARHTNLPDSFKMVITAPDTRTKEGTGSNAQGGEGSVEVSFDRDISKEALENKDLKKKTEEVTWTGEWGINITCTDAGDQEAMFSFFGFRDQPDNGNAWDLDVEWTFKVKE